MVTFGHREGRREGQNRSRRLKKCCYGIIWNHVCETSENCKALWNFKGKKGKRRLKRKKKSKQPATVTWAVVLSPPCCPHYSALHCVELWAPPLGWTRQAGIYSYGDQDPEMCLVNRYPGLRDKRLKNCAASGTGLWVECWGGDEILGLTRGLAGWGLPSQMFKVWNPKLGISDSGVSQQTVRGTSKLWLMPVVGTLKMGRFPAISLYLHTFCFLREPQQTQLQHACDVQSSPDACSRSKGLWVWSLSWGQDALP